MSRILISHPHAAAFATQAAAGLEEGGCLGLYVTGLGAAEGTLRAKALEWLARAKPVAKNRILQRLPPAHVRSLGSVEVVARLGGAFAKHLGSRKYAAYDVMFVAHDAAVAMMSWPRGLRAVYAYEDGALRTFRRAAKEQMERTWDLPLPHYATLARMWLDEARRWPGAMETPRVLPEWKRRRKDAELALADRVSVPSGYTRESLEDLGLKIPITVTPFGFPTDEFAPKISIAPGPFTVIAVGSHDLRKGTPYLLEAWKKAALPASRLILVGPMRLTRKFMSRYTGVFEHIPHIPRTLLGDVYRTADLLALPTLGDGCPLVVQEAMCCGTPVVTTRCGNGPEFITNEVDGWIVPERNVDALVAILRRAAADRDRTFNIGKAARTRAEGWTRRDAGIALARAFCSS